MRSHLSLRAPQLGAVKAGGVQSVITAIAPRLNAYEDCRRTEMAKGYWITFYRSISDPAALAAYGKLAGPAIIANGGRFLARGDAAKAYEQGIAQRVTVTEFDSVQQAVAAHDSAAYREALKALGNACERDVRIVEGLE